MHSCEFNDRIPPYYYTINRFEPRKMNDYTDLDRVLNNINETVVVKFSIMPADISVEMAEYTRYLARLQSINRFRDDPFIEDEGYIDYFAPESVHHYRIKSAPKILRYRDPLADDILRTLQRTHESFREPHLLFDVCVLSETPEIARLVGATVAESAFENGGYRLLPYTDTVTVDTVLRHAQNFKTLYTPSHTEIFSDRDPIFYSGLARLSQLATVDELSTLFCLPVASSTSPFCIRKNTDPPDRNDYEIIVFGLDQEGSKDPRGTSIKNLCKHLAGFGMSGVGKSTSVLNFCLQLNRHNIPFIVFEPVKSEYRILKTLQNHPDKNARNLAKKLEIYTLGDESISRFRLNPLEILPGISRDEHIEGVLSCFKASMPLSGPLPAILGEALERVYELYSDRSNPPRIVDLVRIIPIILQEKGYSRETCSDILAASEVRVSDLTRRNIGKIFQCKKSIPNIRHLIKVPSIIEMDRLHEESTSFIFLLILMNILAHLRTIPKSKKSPRLVIIIEEAHNIVGNNGKAAASPDIADPKPFAAEFVCRFLAEIRALDVCVFVVDQSPTAVAPQVVKHTSTKLAFRQVAREDREELAASMLLNETEMEDIARLTTGEAFILTENYHKSRRIRATNIHEQFDLRIDVKNNNIIPYLHADTWFQKAGRDITASELLLLSEDMNRFDDERLRLVSRLVTLEKTRVDILHRQQSTNSDRALSALIDKASSLKKAFFALSEHFKRDSYNRFMLTETAVDNTNEKEINALKKTLKARYEDHICPDIKKCVQVIDTLIVRCKADIKETAV